MPTAGECPSTHDVDFGDYAEPITCDLPIEHNVDGLWHQGGWTNDSVELTVRWAPEIGEYEHWPPPPYVGPDPLLLNRLTARMLGPNNVFERIPVHTGATIQFRKWAPLNPNYRYSDEPPVLIESDQ